MGRRALRRSAHGRTKWRDDEWRERGGARCTGAVGAPATTLPFEWHDHATCSPFESASRIASCRTSSSRQVSSRTNGRGLIICGCAAPSSSSGPSYSPQCSYSARLMVLGLPRTYHQGSERGLSTAATTKTARAGEQLVEPSSVQFGDRERTSSSSAMSDAMKPSFGQTHGRASKIVEKAARSVSFRCNMK